MINKRAKGNRNQLKLIKSLEKAGYLVDKVEKTGKFTKVKDLFGLFDLIGIHEIKSSIIFAQATSNKPHPHKKYLRFSEVYDHVDILICQVVFRDYKQPKVFVYVDGKKRSYIL